VTVSIESFIFFQKSVRFQTTGQENGFTWVSLNPWPLDPVASQARGLASKCQKICSSWKKGKTDICLSQL